MKKKQYKKRKERRKEKRRNRSPAPVVPPARVDDNKLGD